jgi:cytochrome c oxidase subunit 2
MNDWLRGWLNLPPQASTYAQDVDLLHYFVISATMLGATFVFLLGLYYLVRYRRREAQPTTLRLQTSVPTEIVIIGGILGLFLVFWVVGATQYNRMFSPPADAIPVYVTGKQWMWEFAYPDGRSSMDVLTVPAHRPVKLVMTSRDVIHSFYVPAFRMKHDVVPGRYYTAWFEANAPGVYPVECAEFCGVSHSRMLGQVLVLSQADYERWLQGRPATTSEGFAKTSGPPGGDLVQVGRDVAVRRGCFSCHTIDGQSHVGPTWAGLYESRVSLADGRVVTADDAYLTKSMMEPQADVVAGFKSVMPTYRGALAEPEVAALVEFIRSLRNQPIRPTIELPAVVPLGSAQPQEPRP